MAQTPQLAMRHENLGGLLCPKPAFGYLCRTYRPGDATFWCEIMEGNIGEQWTPEKFERAISRAPQFDPKGLFFVTYGSRPAGTACAWLKAPGEKETGTLHMVAVKDEHRGRALGSYLTLRVLQYFVDRGFSACNLTTDDWRIPAIKTYLNLGFRPVHSHESHRKRWEKIFSKLQIDPDRPLGGHTE
ncbi:MAG: GNAT family N-acetyltransferase [Planctomycetes bacterium]|nr:GNAT family N-acetyltransferase [Planctomycetota bacterium]